MGPQPSIVGSGSGFWWHHQRTLLKTVKRCLTGFQALWKYIWGICASYKHWELNKFAFFLLVTKSRLRRSWQKVNNGTCVSEMNMFLLHCSFVWKVFFMHGYNTSVSDENKHIFISQSVLQSPSVKLNQNGVFYIPYILINAWFILIS